MDIKHENEFFPEQLMKRFGVISDLFWTIHSTKAAETWVKLDRFDCKQIIQTLIEARK